jgi:hypothetical protein
MVGLVSTRWLFTGRPVCGWCVQRDRGAHRPALAVLSVTTARAEDWDPRIPIPLGGNPAVVIDAVTGARCMPASI